MLFDIVRPRFIGMKCPCCDEKMEQGTAVCNLNTNFLFISDKKRKKKGLKGFTTKDSIVAFLGSGQEQPAWHCTKCKKIVTIVPEI